jgi:hypothetical protein
MLPYNYAEYDATFGFKVQRSRDVNKALITTFYIINNAIFFSRVEFIAKICFQLDIFYIYQ